jgi:hypothetical protein
LCVYMIFLIYYFLHLTCDSGVLFVLYASVILYNYINESASTNSLDMRAIHLSCQAIGTSPLKNVKKLK